MRNIPWIVNFKLPLVTVFVLQRKNYHSVGSIIAEDEVEKVKILWLKIFHSSSVLTHIFVERALIKDRQFFISIED